MADDHTPPTLTAQGRAEQQAKRDRQAAALRENLLRRKAQSRAREAVATDAPPEPDRDPL